MKGQPRAKKMFTSVVSDSRPRKYKVMNSIVSLIKIGIGRPKTTSKSLTEGPHLNGFCCGDLISTRNIIKL